jgi:hypothetical protein
MIGPGFTGCSWSKGNSAKKARYLLRDHRNLRRSYICNSVPQEGQLESSDVLAPCKGDDAVELLSAASLDFFVAYRL